MAKTFGKIFACYYGIDTLTLFFDFGKFKTKLRCIRWFFQKVRIVFEKIFEQGFPAASNLFRAFAVYVANNKVAGFFDVLSPLLVLTAQFKISFFLFLPVITVIAGKTSVLAIFDFHNFTDHSIEQKPVMADNQGGTFEVS